MAESIERLQELNDIKSVMETPAGRRFIWRVMDRAGVFRGCFTGNSTTFYNEGRRDMGLFVLNDVLETCPKLFSQAQDEQKETNEKRDEAERKRTDD